MKTAQIFLVALIVLMLSFFSHLLITGKIVQQCTDSDGKDFYTKGQVLTESGVIEDSCSGKNVIEYYCSRNTLRFELFICAHGCDEGKCMRESAEEQHLLGNNIREAVPLGKHGNQLEFNEHLGDVVQAFSESELVSLQDGVVATQQGLTQYHQTLVFGNSAFTSGILRFTRNADDEVGTYLVFNERTPAFEYGLDFGAGLRSTVENNRLVDLEHKELHVLGRKYTIAAATLQDHDVELRLLSGGFTDSLQEKKSKTYTVDGKSYIVNVVLIDDATSGVLIKVNGEQSSLLHAGEVASFADGFSVGIADVIRNEAGEGSDLVTFYLGAENLVFRDMYTDDTFQQQVKVDGRSVSEGYVRIKGVKEGNVFTLSSLHYQVQPAAQGGGDVYVQEGHGMKEYLQHPEAMLADWDIFFNGLQKEDSTLVKIDNSGAGKYTLAFITTQGDSYTIPFVANANNNLILGDGDSILFFIESQNTSDYKVRHNDYFALTDQNDRNGVTHVLRYNSVDTSAKVLSFSDAAKGNVNVPYTGTEGVDATGNIVSGGQNYKVYIGSAPDYKLAVDFTHDGSLNGGEANIVLQGGGILDLGSTSTPNTDFSITLTTKSKQFDGAHSDEVLAITIQKSGSSVDLTLPSQSGLTILTTRGDTEAMSDYGVSFRQKVKDGPDTLKIQYPLHESFADAHLVFYAQQPMITYSVTTPEIVSEQPQAKVMQATQETNITQTQLPAKEIQEEQPTVVQEKPLASFTFDFMREFLRRVVIILKMVF